MVHLRENHDGWSNVRWAVVGACKPAFFDTLREAKKYAFECNDELKKMVIHTILFLWNGELSKI